MTLQPQFAGSSKARRNRNRFQIIADILSIALNGTLKTHIMYKANLSFAQLALYLNFLTGNGMLQCRQDERKNSTIFKTSLAGSDFLAKYESLNALVSIDNKRTASFITTN